MEWPISWEDVKKELEELSKSRIVLETNDYGIDHLRHGVTYESTKILDDIVNAINSGKNVWLRCVYEHWFGLVDGVNQGSMVCENCELFVTGIKYDMDGAVEGIAGTGVFPFIPKNAVYSVAVSLVKQDGALLCLAGQVEINQLVST